MTNLRRTLLVAIALLTPSVSRAQRGIESELFHPALDSYGIITVERAQTSHQWDFGFKLFLDYAQSPLKLAFYDATSMGPRTKAAMDWQVALHFGAHLGLTNWLEAAVQVPISAQGYSDAYGSYGSAADPMITRTGFYAADRFTNIPPPDAAPLDARLALKARLFRKDLFGMALIAAATVPFGDDAAFLGDTGFTFRPSLVMDVTKGPLTFALNVGAIVREQTTVYDPHDQALKVASPRVLLQVGHEMTAAAGIAYRFVQWVGIAAEAYSYLPLLSSKVASRDFTADVLGALQIYPARDLVLAIGAGGGVVPGAARRDDFRVLAGLSWAPAEQKGAVSANAIDSDGDGIPDGQDLCPNEPEDKDGFEDEDGCPDLDNDHDGIPDKLDKCPNEAEDRDGHDDEDGCPDPDNDGDGIPDVQDKCPNDPEDRDGFQDDDGCPDADNDGDGIPDAVDKCPNEPETRNGVDDEDGCPDSGGAPVAVSKLELSGEPIAFDAGKSTLTAKATAALDSVAAKITASAAKRVRIEGHADTNEAGKRTETLSQARAAAVREYLIKKGVDGDRLQAVGYGDKRLLDTKRNAAARAKNRRVELIVVEQ
jgi:outer membrane protein OmpA-like peptidoglycan-associated protein